MKLRKHQAELVEVCGRILAGHGPTTIIQSVTPGGGKSASPVILAENLIPAVADKLLWVVPRNSLKYQGEEEFLDPRWNTKHRLRALDGNQDNPSRGFSGYITTYQAIGQDPRPHWAEFTEHRYILFLDEPHHIAEDASWERAIRPLINNAELVVFASGTLSRGDGKRIAFLDYEGDVVNLAAGGDTAVIRYSRSDAIRDEAICPVEFRTVDGTSEWEELDGEHRSSDLSTSGEDSAKALFTALRTEYAYQLLTTTANDWARYRESEYPNAKLLIVAPNIELAKLYMNFMERHFPGQLGAIATSEDTARARTNIEDYKMGVLSYLVTVAMAYEGLSVKEITHIACLTHIRSVPWLEQCFGRGNRLAPGKRQAWVYGPADPDFREAIRMIEAEQLVPVGGRDEVDRCEWEPGEGAGGERPWINPLRSEAFGDIAPPAPAYSMTVSISQQELALRKIIRDRREVLKNRKRNGAQKSFLSVFNRTIKTITDRPLGKMNLDELHRVDSILRERFPV
jgi:superfamily II DNA or RNA helicase